MNRDNPELETSASAGQDVSTPVDFAYLDLQILADRALERELLELFVAQARRLLPGLPGLSPQRQVETAHLLKGSARGIGAWAAAAAANAYEGAPDEHRALAYPALVHAFAAVEAAIAARLTDGPA